MENRIVIEGRGGAFGAYVARPAALPAPGVVVLQELRSSAACNLLSASGSSRSRRWRLVVVRFRAGSPGQFRPLADGRMVLGASLPAAARIKISARMNLTDAFGQRRKSPSLGLTRAPGHRPASGAPGRAAMARYCSGSRSGSFLRNATRFQTSSSLWVLPQLGMPVSLRPCLITQNC